MLHFAQQKRCPLISARNHAVRRAAAAAGSRENPEGYKICGTRRTMY